MLKRSNNISKVKFEPSGLFKNGHFQTIWSALTHNPADLDSSRKVQVKINNDITVECEYDVPSGNQSAGSEKNTCVILIHGLEGSAKSNYIVSTAKKLLNRGIDVLRMNLRNCGNTMHLANTFYNAGLSGDVSEVIRYCSEQLGHKKIFIAGFSLGANTVLKLAGELTDGYPPELAGVCAVSPPLDLSLCSHTVIKPKNKIYDRYYLNRMRKTYRRKKEYFPELVQLELLEKVRNLYDFDNYIIAPGFNYKDAEDYYACNSSLKFLDTIKVKTLIIQAKDDPIIPPESTEKAISLANSSIEIVFTDHGGHVGFINSRQASLNDIDRNWAENRIIEFIENI